MNNQAMLDVIKCGLWGGQPCNVDDNVLAEMRMQAVEALPADILSQLKMPDELRQQWQTFIYQHISFNVKYKRAQETLPITVPFVILKGTAAAKYYPHPELRIMGDIDIMTRREDYKKACEDLLSGGYVQIPSDEIEPRHSAFKKDKIIVEVHYYFAYLNSKEQAKYLDDLIISNITSWQYLPDNVNGLVLLEHISQHLENGLGLRQIIDWMMYVDKCLPDDKWHEFKKLSANIGLENLAIVTTRMCEIYLGLPKRKWCSTADIKICGQLMDYILANGNFGKKRTSAKDITENVFAYASSARTALSLLQERGVANWKVAHNYRIFRLFAWIYQGFRYLSRGLRQENARQRLKEEYKAAKKKNAMLDALGVKTRAKGIVKFQNGEYTKKVKKSFNRQKFHFAKGNANKN